MLKNAKLLILVQKIKMLGEQLGKKFMYGSLVEVNAQYMKGHVPGILL